MKNGEAIIVDCFGMIWKIAAGCETISLEKIREIVTDVRGYQVVCGEDNVIFQTLRGNTVLHEIDVPVDFKSRQDINEEARVLRLLLAIHRGGWREVDASGTKLKMIDIQYIENTIKEIWPESTTETEAANE